MSRNGIGWKARKALCRGRGCHNPRPPDKDLCRECWLGQQELDALKLFVAERRQVPNEGGSNAVSHERRDD